MEIDVAGGRVIIILKEEEVKLLVRLMSIVLTGLTYDITRLIEGRVREVFSRPEGREEEVCK